MIHARNDDPEKEKKAEANHGTAKHLQLQFYNIESFEMSLSLNHFHMKLSVEILEMFPNAIKLR